MSSPGEADVDLTPFFFLIKNWRVSVRISEQFRSNWVPQLEASHYPIKGWNAADKGHCYTLKEVKDHYWQAVRSSAVSLLSIVHICIVFFSILKSFCLHLTFEKFVWDTAMLFGLFFNNLSPSHWKDTAAECFSWWKELFYVKLNNSTRSPL